MLKADNPQPITIGSEITTTLTKGGRQITSVEDGKVEFCLMFGKPSSMVNDEIQALRGIILLNWDAAEQAVKQLIRIGGSEPKSDRMSDNMKKLIRSLENIPKPKPERLPDWYKISAPRRPFSLYRLDVTRRFDRHRVHCRPPAVGCRSVARLPYK